MLSHTNPISFKSIFFHTSMTIAIALTGVAMADSLASPASAQRRQSYGLGMPQTAGVGTTRTGTTLPSVALLVPSDGARTLSARPTFYWYIAPQVGDTSAKSSKITFFLREDPKISAKAIFRAEGTIVQPGLYRFTLPKEAPELVIGKAQRWQIRWQEDIGGVESSVNVNAIILRENNPTIKAALAKTSNDLQQARVYAEANYWYDALDAYTRWIEKNPKDAAARKERDELLAIGFQPQGTASQQITNVNALIANLNGAVSQAIALTGRTR